jgi:hypothetical protein
MDFIDFIFVILTFSYKQLALRLTHRSYRDQKEEKNVFTRIWPYQLLSFHCALLYGLIQQVFHWESLIN